MPIRFTNCSLFALAVFTALAIPDAAPGKVLIADNPAKIGE